MAPADALWWRADRPVNPLVIDTLLWTSEPLGRAGLIRLLRERLLARHPVFGQRVLEPPLGIGLPLWEDAPGFDVRDRVLQARLPAPGSLAELQAYVSRAISRPLDPAAPPWEVHLVQGYGRGSAVLFRVHHAMADGVALVRVLLSMTDPAPNSPPDETDGRPTPAVHPVLPTSPSDLAHVANKLVLGHDARTALHRPVGSQKVAVWSRARSLPKVKRAAKACGATVNDILLTALAEALSRYLTPRGGTVDHLTTLVPVNLRPPHEDLPPLLGNRFALVFLPLPTMDCSAAERLERTRREMLRIKGSSEATVTFGLMNAVGAAVPALEHLAVDFFSGKGIGVTTNVPGPRTARYLAGRRVAGLLGWVPGAGAQTTGVCIVTYAGSVRVGFRLDAGVPDPGALVTAYDQALDALEAVRPTSPAIASA